MQSETTTYSVSLANPSSAVDWVGLKPLLRPQFQPADSWDVLYSIFVAKLGTNYGQLQTVLAQAGQDLVEPVVVAPRTRPRQHPTALHDWSFANMLALDARLSRAGDLKVLPASVRLETLDAQGHAVVTGTAPV